MVFRERTYPSGYAPRTIQLSTDADENPDILYVGCKDGSVTAVEGFKPSPLIGPDRARAAVRSLCAWDQARILVGRNDGRLELIDRTTRTVEPVLGTGVGGPVLTVARIDASRVLVSSRTGGCQILKGAAGESPAVEGEPLEFGGRRGRRSGKPESTAIRFVAPLVGLEVKGEEGAERLVETGKRWLFVSERGDLFSWDGKSNRVEPAPDAARWPRGERPAAVNDIGLWRADKARREHEPARGAFLATDTGVYLVDLDKACRLRLCRLSLSGLGSICTALSYTEDRSFRYLWAADLSGDCHLFWDRRRLLGESQYLDFRRTGLVHADSQVLVCFAWFEESREKLFFGQARRNDRIVISEYSALDSDEPTQDRDFEIRRLLSRGPVAGITGIRSFLRKLDEERRSVNASGVERDLTEPEGKDSRYPPWFEQEDPAVLAELFEHLSSDPRTRRIVLESLLGQSVADAILEGAVLQIADGKSGMRVAKAVANEVDRRLQTWNLSLLGIIHRHSVARERDAAYLALLRWLRNRQERLRKLLSAQLDWSAKHIREVESRVEVSVRFARKWGVYAEANAWRENLVLPLRRLQGDPPSEAERLDHLTYQILLYERQVSLQGPVAEEPMRGRTAWSVASLELDRNVRVAVVSWTWGGVEVFQVRPEGSVNEASLELAWELRPVRRESAPGDEESSRCPVTLHAVEVRGEIGASPRPIPRDPDGHSRAIHLGRVRDFSYLLAAPVCDPRKGGRECLVLWRLSSSGEGVHVETPSCATLPVEPETESVHSLVEIEEGWLLVGLKGRRQVGRVGLVEIRDDGAHSIVWHGSVRLEDRAAYGRGEEIGEAASEASRRAGERPDGVGGAAEQAETNRAWSLAVGRRPSPAGCQISVYVGCERGQIFHLALDREGERWKLPASPDGTGGPEVVARLSSSVRALACRETEGGGQRLFAGGEDGTIIAWAEAEDRTDRGAVRDGEVPERRFVSLWATAERGAVAGLHLLEGIELERERSEREGQGGGRAVLAITRGGRAVLLDDRERAGEPTDRRHGEAHVPTRIPLPGCRHGRPRFPMSCFASLVVSDGRAARSPGEADGHGAARSRRPRSASCEVRAIFEPKVELLVASGDGTVHLVGIHDPSITDSRKERYQEVLEDWWKVLKAGQQLRLGSALYRTAPAVERILVRWLIDPSYPPQCQPDPKKFSLPSQAQSWWLPRHLRPLLDLKESWAALEANGLDGEEQVRRVGRSLALALKRAWQYDDLGLYQEICAVVLKRANFVLFDRLRRKRELGFNGPGEASPQWQCEKRKLRGLYEELFGALERTVQRWLGAGEEKEARAHMAIVKQLVDGDTVRQLFREVEVEAVEANRAAGEAMEESAPCTAILHRRIRGVSDLVFKRNPLVNLEAVRAANLSLFRMCKRLSSEPSEGWAGRSEVQWRVFEPYFHHLVAAAARIFASSIELSDALAHEYGRTFALAICACPSATIRIANLLTETQLITDPDSEEDFSHRVSWQLRLLENLGLKLPEQVPLLFEAVVRPRRGVVNPMDQVWEDLKIPGHEERKAGRPVPPDPLRWTRFGSPNDYDLTCMEHLYDGVVGWFVRLEEKLATDAHEINLTLKADGEERRLADLADRLHELSGADHDDFFLHSREFWDERCVALAIDLDGHVRGVSERIRPEIVLVSPKLQAWAVESLDRLDQRYRTAQIFQPEYRHFREVLLRFERAAKAFPTSAAVHKSIVEGVLGHHLLEDLDEHVLELIEIAHVLDPLKVQGYLERGRPPAFFNRPPAGTAEGFATYLLGRSRNAESIPKNLRTLQNLLVSREERGEEVPIQEVIDRALRHGPESTHTTRSRWDVPKRPAISVPRTDARFLELIIRELDQNDRAYGPADSQASDWGRPKVTFKRRTEKDVVHRVAIRFQIRRDLRRAGRENALVRLRELCDQGLQAPFRPWPDRSYASHGTGLYLANLAAAVVHWRLQIMRKKFNANTRTVTFYLDKLETADAPGTRSDRA